MKSTLKKTLWMLFAALVVIATLTPKHVNAQSTSGFVFLETDQTDELTCDELEAYLDEFIDEIHALGGPGISNAYFGGSYSEYLEYYHHLIDMYWVCQGEQNPDFIIVDELEPTLYIPGKSSIKVTASSSPNFEMKPFALASTVQFTDQSTAVMVSPSQPKIAVAGTTYDHGKIYSANSNAQKFEVTYAIVRVRQKLTGKSHVRVVRMGKRYEAKKSAAHHLKIRLED